MMMRPVGVGLHVARPDRRRGIDDHRGKPVARDHVGDEVLGDDLAALVGADRFGVPAECRVSSARPPARRSKVATELV